MMTALAGNGPDELAFGGRFFGPTYNSCAGVAYVPSYYNSCSGSSCYGGSYYSACTGCYGSSCGYSSCGYSSYASACCGYSSCCGGLFSGGRLSGFHTSCGGCCGYTSCGGYTSSYYYGSCLGSSCCGGCYGSPYYSAYGGCYGSCVGALAPSYSPMMHAAPTAGVPVGGVVVANAPAPAVAVASASRSDVGTNGLLAAAPKDAGAPARLAIELPAAAVLYVDGVAVPGSGATRQFHTPELARGKAYYYELRADALIDGKFETEAKKVVVRAGDSAIEAFPKLIALAAKATPAVLAAK